MLIGEYESKVGEKNRIAVPKRFREVLGDRLIITRGYENCLILVDHKRWLELIKSIEVRPLLDASVRDVKRFLIGGAYEVELDSQGRFVLSNSLINFASISVEVIFVGIENWIEIWDKNKWIGKIGSLTSNISDISQRLSELNSNE